MATASNVPEEYARALLSHLRHERVSDIETLAGEIGLTVREVDAVNFEGALIRVPNKPRGIVAVKQSIREPGRRNFTIAHEIAHFILPGHGLEECYCKSTEIESWQKNVIRSQELAANAFASELLLPSRHLYPIVNGKELTIALAKELSAQFNTSLTATLVKCAKVTEEVCAVICSVDGVIKWSQKSEGFYHFIPYTRLASDTLAGRLFASSTDSEFSGEVLANSWIESNKIERDLKLWEESILLPYYNSVLTILTI